MHLLMACRTHFTACSLPFWRSTAWVLRYHHHFCATATILFWWRLPHHFYTNAWSTDQIFCALSRDYPACPPGRAARCHSFRIHMITPPASPTWWCLRIAACRYTVCRASTYRAMTVPPRNATIPAAAIPPHAAVSSFHGLMISRAMGNHTFYYYCRTLLSRRTTPGIPHSISFPAFSAIRVHRIVLPLRVHTVLLMHYSTISACLPLRDRSSDDGSALFYLHLHYDRCTAAGYTSFLLSTTLTFLFARCHFLAWKAFCPCFIFGDYHTTLGERYYFYSVCLWKPDDEN